MFTHPLDTMRFTISVLAVLAAITPALGRPADDTPDTSSLPCIGKCFLDGKDSDYLNSKCDGDEVGSDLVDCTCDSIKAADFFPCMKKCPQDEKDEYEKGFQGSCDDLFGASSNKDDDDSATDESESEDSEDAAVRNAPAVLAVGSLVAAFLI